MGIDQPTPGSEERETPRVYQKLSDEQKALHNRETLHYREGSYTPDNDEIGRAEEMVHGNEVWKTEHRERAIAKYRENVEKLEQMGKTEFAKRSEALAMKIAEVIAKVKDELVKDQQEIIRQAFEETERRGSAKFMPFGADFADYAVPEYKEAGEDRDKIIRTAIRLERFEPIAGNYTDPVSIVGMPGNSDWPVHLFSKNSIMVRHQTTAEEMKDQIPEAWEMPIYWKVWKKVEPMLSPEEQEMVELIRLKQNEIQGVFEQ